MGGISSAVTITLPKSLVQELMRRAKENGVSIEEYLADLIISDLDPRERAKKYIRGAFGTPRASKRRIKKRLS